MPTMVNCRAFSANDPRVIYCGREFNGWIGSPLGNPFRVGFDGDLETVLLRYEVWLNHQLRYRIPEVVAVMEAIQPDSRLACWCFPERCHCEVIIRVWQETFNQENSCT